MKIKDLSVNKTSNYTDNLKIDEANHNLEIESQTIKPKSKDIRISSADKVDIDRGKPNLETLGYSFEIGV